MVVFCVAPPIVGRGVAACLRSRRETVTRDYVSEVAVIEMHGNVSEFIYKQPRSISWARVLGQISNLSVNLESGQLQS